MTSGEVFVVDDDASVRKAIERLLRTAGYPVRTFGSAEEVIAAIQRGPACLIVDVRMPDCTGLDLVDMLRKAQDAPAVIFITGHCDPAMAVRAIEAGAVVFPKPFDDEALLEAVAQAVNRVRR